MRERLLTQVTSPLYVRITPAYAGKTFSRHFKEGYYQDHPRVCGKDPATAAEIINQVGSPPRMRERLYFLGIALPMVRITPAYAGKTQFRLSAPVCDGDHPRVCGKDSYPP